MPLGKGKGSQLPHTRYSVEVLPIYVITAAAVGGASWYISRLARGPDVVWDHKVGAAEGEIPLPMRARLTTSPAG